MDRKLNALWIAALALAVLAGGCRTPPPTEGQDGARPVVGCAQIIRPFVGAHILWNVDNTQSIGGNAVTVAGAPKVITTPGGKAVEFDGVGDGLFLDVHPMAGWSEFTLEVIFRPDAAGREAQRFFHLQEGDSDNRVLIETRRIGAGEWSLDTFIKCGDAVLVQYDAAFKHPLGQWYNATLVYDGREVRHYLNGALELSTPFQFVPPHAGRTSIGVRINRMHWFKGAIRQARFTPRALAPSEFLKP